MQNDVKIKTLMCMSLTALETCIEIITYIYIYKVIINNIKT